MKNQRGGIISKLFVIPIGVVMMVGFFFLGYYVGKHQAGTEASNQILPPLPEVVSKNIPKQEEFTFYRTLTEKDGKTISVDLRKEKPAPDPPGETQKEAAPGPQKEKTAHAPKQEKHTDSRKDKPVQAQPKQPVEKAPPVPAKKEPPPAPDQKLRYTIQLASYQDRGEAEGEVARMKKKGYAAFIVSSDVPEKGTWYRVRLGSFVKRSSAEKLVSELRTKEGLTSFVTIE